MDKIKQYKGKKGGYVSGCTNRKAVESNACLCLLISWPWCWDRTHCPLHAVPAMQVDIDGDSHGRTGRHHPYVPIPPHHHLPQLSLFCTPMSSRASVLKVWPRTNSISISWELVRNAESPIRRFKPRRIMCTLKVEKHKLEVESTST